LVAPCFVFQATFWTKRRREGIFAESEVYVVRNEVGVRGA
jgi:hypothetical protein